jgi:DNA-directed RNA polymerase specialized sigma24 family protein
MDSGPSDEMLLLAVAEHDMGAFRTLYERHAGWLAVRLARRCNDRDLVADAIGDTFVAVWQKPRGFRGDGEKQRLVARAAVHALTVASPGRKRFTPRQEFPGAFRSRVTAITRAPSTNQRRGRSGERVTITLFWVMT